MRGNPVLSCTCIAVIGMAGVNAFVGVAAAQAPVVSAATEPGQTSPPLAAGAVSVDMAMPDDLGAPLPGAAAPQKTNPRSLSINTPIVQIAGTVQGRAVLERDLPGLCERPEYVMFKGMSLTTLAGMSHGRIGPAKLDQVQADLIQVDMTGTAAAPVNPITQGRRSITRMSRSIYHRVAMVIAAL